eukprot:tig00000492_g1550.t1
MGRGGRHPASFMVLSNSALLLAAGEAARRGWRPHATVYGLSALASTWYHLDGERGPSAPLDRALALLVLACNVHALASSCRAGCIRSPYAMGALALAAVSGLVYSAACSDREAYERAHPWWHLAAGIGTWLVFRGM